MAWEIGATELQGTTPAPPNPLPAPLNLRAVCATDAKTAEIRWDAVPGATAYYFRAESNGSSVAYVDGLNAVSYLLPVTPGVSYHVWVHGYNSAYPPADPVFPPGVGDSSAIDFACQPVVVPPDPVPIPPDPIPAPSPGITIRVTGKETTVKVSKRKTNTSTSVLVTVNRDTKVVIE